MKFCVDCKWHRVETVNGLPLHVCTGCVSEVTGKPKTLPCEAARLGPCRGGSRFTPLDYGQALEKEPLNG